MPKRDREDVSRARGKNPLCFILYNFTIFYTKYMPFGIVFLRIFEKIYLSA
jgi:hypothetical protein